MNCLSNFLLRKYGPIPNFTCNNWVNSYRTDSVEMGVNLCERGNWSVTVGKCVYQNSNFYVLFGQLSLVQILSHPLASK